MAGEMVHRMTMMEIINVIATANWVGRLHVVSGDVERALLFEQGVLKFATSSAPEDRLGQILFSNGVVTYAQLAQLLEESGPDRRLGSLCVERGLLDQPGLFALLQKQCEQIFYAALLMFEGSFVFVRPDGSEEPPAMAFHIPVQGLLMEGVQRIDEMALFRDKIASSQMVPLRRESASDKSLDASAARVLSLCDGRRTIEDIARATGLGEFGATKAIYHLLSQKLVELHASPKVDGQAVQRLVGQFNEVMQDIFMAVATYGGVAQTRQTLGAWIQGSGYGIYFGESVDEFGCVDPAHVASALGRIGTEHPLEGLIQALHELAAFALFAATTSLPRDQELALARDVNARLKQIRVD